MTERGGGQYGPVEEGKKGWRDRERVKRVDGRDFREEGRGGVGGQRDGGTEKGTIADTPWKLMHSGPRFIFVCTRTNARARVGVWVSRGCRTSSPTGRGRGQL